MTTVLHFIKSNAKTLCLNFGCLFLRSKMSYMQFTGVMDLSLPEH